MQAVGFSKVSVTIYLSAQCHIPEDWILSWDCKFSCLAKQHFGLKRITPIDENISVFKFHY